jgi:FIST N domain.
MKIQQLQYSGKTWKIVTHPDGFERMQCQLVLAFGETPQISETPVFNHLERSYPEACIILCSTEANNLFKNVVTVTAVEFDKTAVLCAETCITDHTDNMEAGKCLMQQLQPAASANVYILANGPGINGRELVQGFNANRPGYTCPVNNTPFFIKRAAGLNKIPGAGAIVAVVLQGREQSCFQMDQYLHVFTTATLNRLATW